MTLELATQHLRTYLLPNLKENKTVFQYLQISKNTAESYIVSNG